MPQIATRIVGVENRAIRREREPARTGAVSGQGVFVNRHGAGVNSGQLVGPELAEHGRVVGQNHDAVRNRFGRGQLRQRHLPGLGVEPTDVVCLLVGEPQNSIVVERGRMRIDLGIAGRAVFGNFARLRIQLPDVASRNCSKPDVPLLIRNQAVRPRAGRLQGILHELSGFRIEPAQLVSCLARVPERAVGGERRIMRARFRGRNLIFLDRHAQRSDSGERENSSNHCEHTDFGEGHGWTP